MELLLSALTIMHENKEFIALVAGFVGTYLTIRRQTKVFQTYVAMEFFKRYSIISEQMPDNLRLAKYQEPGAVLTDADWASITRSMIQYLNLCSEEFALHSPGRVPQEIWKIWVSGIRENFEARLWREAWQKVRREYESFTPFVQFMETTIAEAEAAEAKRK